MFKSKDYVHLNTVIIGSGLSALNFIDTFSKKKKKVDVISPNFEFKLSNVVKLNTESLPPQMLNKNIKVENYFFANSLVNSKFSKIIGSLDFGGLSNYWGLQIDDYIYLKDLKTSKSVKKKINESFFDFLRKYNLLGRYNHKNKVYSNEFNIPRIFENLLQQKNKNFKLHRPILAYNNKLKKNILAELNEKRDKLNSKNFLKFSKLKKKIKFHNFYLESMQDFGNKIKLICKNKNSVKIFIVNKVILATGTIATTKIIMDYLKITDEIKINHHPRLISVYLARNNIDTNLKFTPSLLQIIGKINKNYFSSDLRPGNEKIINAITDINKFFTPLKPLLKFIKGRLLFSNILLSSGSSDLYLKKINKKFHIYTKKNDIISKLKKANLKIFSLLLKKKLIFPFYKTHFPGVGSDFHYFGSIKINGKNKLSVNQNCQLKNNKNIYVIDGSIFNFKVNKYPLGIVMANARRVGKLLS